MDLLLNSGLVADQLDLVGYMDAQDVLPMVGSGAFDTKMNFCMNLEGCYLYRSRVQAVIRDLPRSLPPSDIKVGSGATTNPLSSSMYVVLSKQAVLNMACIVEPDHCVWTRIGVVCSSPADFQARVARWGRQYILPRSTT